MAKDLLSSGFGFVFTFDQQYMRFFKDIFYLTIYVCFWWGKYTFQNIMRITLFITQLSHTAGNRDR